MQKGPNTIGPFLLKKENGVEDGTRTRGPRYHKPML